MPRYEFSEGTSNKFWEIKLEGSSFTTRYGRIGTDGQTTTKSFKSPAEAKKQYDKIVAEKVGKGYALVDGDYDGAESKPAPATGKSNAELEAAIERDPDNEDNYLVYADWLSEQGDPRGELAALMAKIRKSPDDAKLEQTLRDLVTEHSEALLGRLTELDEDVAYTWGLGFFESLAIGGDEYSELNGADTWELVAACPSARFCRDLKIGVFDSDSGTLEYDAMIQAMAKRGLPKTLRSLAFDCGDYQISWAELGDISALYPQLQALRSLKIRMGRFDLGKIKLPELRSFEVETGGFSTGNAKSVATADWPKLETLSLYFGTDDYGGDCSIHDVGPILEGKGLANVRSLGLANSQFADEIAAALPKSKILKQLKALDLSKGTMGDEGAQHILDNRDKFAHLERLDLSENYISAELASELKTVCKGVDVDSQGDPGEDGEDRYVQVSE